MSRYLLLFAAVMPLCGAADGLAHIPLPADLSGVHNGTEYKTRVPANWNGTLLVYAHGSGTTELQIAPPTYPQISPSLEEHLLSRGYALAGSFYRDSVKDGSLHTLQLTNYFRGQVGNPRRTIVWGVSLGGDVTLTLMETHPGIYDGAIPVAAEAAGWVRYADSMLRYDVAYAAAFGWPADSWGPIEDIRDDLAGNENTLIAPVFQWAISQNHAQWEFIRLVMKMPPMTWWGIDPLLGLPGYAFAGWAATAVRSKLEDTYGGPVAENVGTCYTLATDEKAYLSTLGVNADQLLDWMNAHTNITARHSARTRLAVERSYSGRLRRPVVMMNGIHDPIVIVSNQAVYRDLAEAAGNANMLVQAYVNAPGHVPFSAEHFLSALAAMEHWLDTGVRPDASFFPESQGFNNSFVPPSWPY
jgi:pimeloyl-ACP methyl ester carboxylesterase